MHLDWVEKVHIPGNSAYYKLLRYSGRINRPGPAPALLILLLVHSTSSLNSGFNFRRQYSLFFTSHKLPCINEDFV